MDEAQQLLALLTQTFPDISRMDPLEARALVDARIRPATNLFDAESTDAVIDTPSGPLAVRVYRPLQPGPVGPLVTLYAHGGGFLHGSIESHDGFCRRWANRTRSTVVSVNYRLAPEAGAPSASEDLVAAASWALREGLGEQLVLAGDSSGANVAAVAALTMRMRGGPTAIAQVLIYPFLDPAQASPSYTERGDRSFVTATTLGAYWSNYLGAPGSREAEPWQINPALAPDLSGLPATVIITAGLDPLAHEGRSFASALAAAGTPVVHRFYPGLFHGFLTIMTFTAALAAQELLWFDLSKFTAPNEGNMT